MLFQDLSERPIRDARGRRRGSGPSAATGSGYSAPSQLPELADEPRLADAGVGHDRDHVRPALPRRRGRRSRGAGRARRSRPTKACCSPPTPRGRMSVSARSSGTPTTPSSFPSPRHAAAGRARRRLGRTRPSARRPGSRPAPAACSRRAATLTASPLTNELPSRGRPTTTSPVFTPVRSESSPSKSVVQATMHRKRRSGARARRGPRGQQERRTQPSPHRRRTSPPSRPRARSRTPSRRRSDRASRACARDPASLRAPSTRRDRRTGRSRASARPSAARCPSARRMQGRTERRPATGRHTGRRRP